MQGLVNADGGRIQMKRDSIKHNGGDYDKTNLLCLVPS